MPVYEIVNPSDPYTFEATDDELARLLGLLVGQGAYGVEDESGATTLSIYLFGVGEGELDALFPPDGFEATAKRRRPDLPAALRTTMIACRAERAGIQAALDATEGEAARTAFLERYHDTKRTSVNDIGSRCIMLANAIDAELESAKEPA